MGSYFDRVSADMKSAMKSGDKPRVEVLRMLMADIKKKRIDSMVESLGDEDEMAVLQKACKMRQDAMEQAESAGRPEFAAKERAEVAMIQEYLPQQMSAEQIQAKVTELAKEIAYAGGKDAGRFMKEWMTRYKGVADGKLVQAALKLLG